MNTTYFPQLCLVAVLLMAFAVDSWATAALAVRIIAIPEREHGYSNFESTVITSQDELDTFLQKDSKSQDMGWNNRAGFETALANAKLDFSRESLVLLRHTEGSGSVQITFSAPQLKDGRIICRIERAEPTIGTADMAYYCFALAVAKAFVGEVELIATGREPIVLSVQRAKSSTRPQAGGCN